MKNILTVTIILALLSSFSSSAYAKKKKDDPLSLAALMIKDKHYLRALGILEKIDPEQAKEKDDDFDLTRYHTLSGITYLNARQYAKAIPHFKTVLNSKDSKPVFHAYLAQAYYKNKEYEKAIKEIDAAPSQKEEKASLILMKIDAYTRLNKPYEAWDSLKEGEALFPYDDRFPKQQVFTLIKHGFYKKAAETGLEYTKKFQPEPTDFIAIGTALSKAGNFELAGKFLEQAKLHFPNDLKTNKALANYYAQKKQYFNAARLMEPIAAFDNSLMTEAAELNKKAKQYVRALFLNSRSNEQGEKLKQRLSLYLESEKYEQAATMERDLKRSKIFQDDNVKYALAYAMFKSGDFQSTERILSQIRDSRVFKNANIIRSAIANCEENKWRCM